MPNFTAILVTNQCVNNAGTNIRRIRKPRTMKWFFTDNENDNFLKGNAVITQIKM
uniref:Uncharacterized protein n=1 Tax=Magallana gigas TaxID=29159 RepID=K1Q1E1_MAGGI